MFVTDSLMEAHAHVICRINKKHASNKDGCTSFNSGLEHVVEHFHFILLKLKM